MQAVCLELGCSQRSDWGAEDAAQNWLQWHESDAHSGPSPEPKHALDDDPNTEEHPAPPGGFDTGERDADPTPPGGQDTGPR